MALSLVSGPTLEPLDLFEAKAHLRVTDDNEDDLILTLIAAARGQAETFCHRAFITQTWDLRLDGFPCDVIELPKPPLVSVTSLTYVDTAGVTQTISPSLYLVDAPAGPAAQKGRIVPAYGQYWPTTRDVPNAVVVRFIAGYGATAAAAVSATPGLIKAAVKEYLRAAWARTDAAETQKIIESANAALWSLKAF